MINSSKASYKINISEAALHYARKGWAVFPCDENKHPLTRHGHLSASADQRIITGYWQRYPQANIGLNCKASGIVVIDIDPRSEGHTTLARLEDDHESLPETLQALTGLQNDLRGHHYYFKAPAGDPQFKGVINPGIDIKYNGYVILPPSVHPSGIRYEWIDPNAKIMPLPEWLKELIVKPAVKIPVRRTRQGDTISDKLNLKVTDIAMPLNPRWRDHQIEGASPFHDSSTGTNFVIDPVRNRWYCRRCHSGGGPLELLAVREGLIRCDEAKPGCLEGIWADVFQMLRNLGYNVDGATGMDSEIAKRFLKFLDERRRAHATG